jgi:hypothetical protein
VWRWVESAQCRRLEVGVEETMVRHAVVYQLTPFFFCFS